MRRRYVVTYDIRDPKRLRRTFKVLRDFGEHLQLSVFECLLNAMELTDLQDQLGEVIHHGEDQVLFFDLGRAESDAGLRITAMGAAYEPKSVQAVVV